MIGTSGGEVRLRGNYSGNKDEKNEQATGHGGRSKGGGYRSGKPYGLPDGNSRGLPRQQLCPPDEHRLKHAGVSTFAPEGGGLDAGSGLRGRLGQCLKHRGRSVSR